VKKTGDFPLGKRIEHRGQRDAEGCLQATEMVRMQENGVARAVSDG
jgi:hypothetical protein